MLSSLLSQFRQRYPQGSLTSELLTIHDGLYVVRVCVGAEGIPLANALGANTALEVAEDLATTRALERLVLPAAKGNSQSQVSTLPPKGIEPVDAPETPATPLPSARPSAESHAEGGNARLELIAPLPGPNQNDFSQPSVQPEPDRADPPVASTPDLPSAALASPPKPSSHPQTPVRDTFDDQDDEFMGLDLGPAASIDLSDIIAQTDVELQRLGWGVNQGREFLEKTYGKRSRHDLTDDELLEFLLFLETQSPPGG